MEKFKIYRLNRLDRLRNCFFNLEIFINLRLRILLIMHSKQAVEKKNHAGKVGVEENNFGFGAGKANKDSKPTRNISNLVNIPK